ncbi:hypothetical protein F5883DRAFT_588677 [Diaporthe sp. PMI_573]|nr:hypothetical protein F5883DRAFT_588677 [Diaporthaceae sp. PMI_573]
MSKAGALPRDSVACSKQSIGLLRHMPRANEGLSDHTATTTRPRPRPRPNQAQSQPNKPVTMLLKRKRSDDELSSFSSSSPLKSATAGDVATLDMDVDMDMNPDTDTHVDTGIDSPLSAMTIRSPGRSCTPSHLPSRTLKRLRNGRPSDHEVHQNTLQMLYRAQQRPQQRPQQPQHVFSPPPAASSSFAPSPVPSVQPHSPAAPAPAQSQRSLHSFWNIPSSHQSSPGPALSSALGPPVDAIVDQPTTCDDCGVELGGEDAAVDDGYGFETYISSCSLCCKAVCFSCSVSNLGEQRRCLVCAGKEDRQKRWVNTTGWAPEPMAVY